MEKSEKFDGNLVFVANNQDIQDGQYYFHNAHLGKFVPINPDLLLILGNLYSHEKKGISDDDCISYDKECVIRERDRSKSLPNPEIYEILETGRLQISLLSNSPGGKSGWYSVMKRAIDYIESKKGRAYSFGGYELSSAAAMLFMLPAKNQRFLSPLTKLMFHLSTSVSEDFEKRAERHVASMDSEEIRLFRFNDREDALKYYLAYYQKEYFEEKEKEILELRDLLLSGVTKKARLEIETILRNTFDHTDAVRPDYPIYINADEAVRLGLAKAVNLRKKFEKVNHVGLEAYSDTTINSFFCEITLRELAIKLSKKV